MDNVFIIMTILAFFGAVIFTVLWIAGKVKKTPNTHGKKAGIALLVCVASFVGFGVTHTSTPVAPPPSQEKHEDAKQESAPSVDSILAKAAEKGVSSYRGVLVKYRDVNVTQHADGTYFVVVNVNGNILPDKADTIAEYKIAAAYVMKEVFNAKVPVNGCNFAVWSDVVEKKSGREENHNVYGLTVRKDAADKINLEKAGVSDIVKIAEPEKILPPLR